MESSHSLPANLHADYKPQVRLKTSTSMSMEAHVSTTLHRTRTVNSGHLLISKEQDFHEDLENNISSAPDTFPTGWLSSGFWAADMFILRQRLARLRWLLVFYCAFSAMFLTSNIFATLSREKLPAKDFVQSGKPFSAYKKLIDGHLNCSLPPALDRR